MTSAKIGRTVVYRTQWAKFASVRFAEDNITYAEVMNVEWREKEHTAFNRAMHAVRTSSGIGPTILLASTVSHVLSNRGIQKAVDWRSRVATAAKDRVMDGPLKPVVVSTTTRDPCAMPKTTPRNAPVARNAIATLNATTAATAGDAATSLPRTAPKTALATYSIIPPASSPPASPMSPPAPPLSSQPATLANVDAWAKLVEVEGKAAFIRRAIHNPSAMKLADSRTREALFLQESLRQEDMHDLPFNPTIDWVSWYDEYSDVIDTQRAGTAGE